MDTTLKLAFVSLTTECVQSLQVNANVDGPSSLFLIIALYTTLCWAVIKARVLCGGGRGRVWWGRGVWQSLWMWWELWSTLPRKTPWRTENFAFCSEVFFFNSLNPICETHQAKASNWRSTPTPPYISHSPHRTSGGRHQLHPSDKARNTCCSSVNVGVSCPQLRGTSRQAKAHWKYSFERRKDSRSSFLLK